ncbi:endoglucanase [Gracilibacillus ureilyticus]|uniref:Endoglucanase n=1 Tax=Gracilibacillus ureilyticus TaxID=531814 RepID=A0A1H9TRY1_9BACI|nr:M20/M25/M40 family metallo-hydrolase [Gracilibacillus ureilyticus]SER99721.1 endoglucanase [Gracilibacillus ureilyticus]
MEQKSLNFLFDLLHTPSPSSLEMNIQKKWLEYVKPHADSIQTDGAGNAIAKINPDADFQLLLAGHCDEVAFIVNRIDDNGFIYIDKMGGINPKAAIGMKVEILGEESTLQGVIGVNAQHHGGMKDDFDVEDLFIDCGAEKKSEITEHIQIGDLVVYRRQSELLMGRYVSGRGLDNRTGAFIVAEVLRRLKEKNLNIGVCAVSTVNEETNMGGAYFAAAGLEPTCAIACDVTFATDYPSVDKTKHGDVRLGGGPVLAKGASINRKMNQWLETAAKKLDMPIQYELTPRHTGTDADKMRVTGKGVPVSLVSLPLRYMHSPVETVSIADIDAEIELLVEMITSLKGTESLKPIDID